MIVVPQLFQIGITNKMFKVKTVARMGFVISPLILTLLILKFNPLTFMIPTFIYAYISIKTLLSRCQHCNNKLTEKYIGTDDIIKLYKDGICPSCNQKFDE